MTIKTRIVTVLALSLLFAACKKDQTTKTDDDNSKVPLPKKTELLPDSKWLKTLNNRITYFGNDSSTQILLGNEEDCFEDNILMLKKNFAVYEDEGSLKCNDSDPQEDSIGTWGLINNNSKYVFHSVYNYSDTFDIVEVSDTAFKLEHRFQSVNGNNYMDRVWYKKVK